ncbi:glutathione ABC transporter permease [Labrys miyagiensis]
MAYVLKRTGQAILVLAGVITLIFFVLRLVPGDPVSVIAPTATAAAKAEIRANLGLDLPLWQQYAVFLKNVAQGDFGQSYFFQGRAIDLVLTALPYTAALATLAIVIALCIALPAGIASAMNADHAFDRTMLGFCLLFQSAPNFWLALLMLSMVAVKSGLFPTVGYVGPISLVLPAVTLSISLIAILTQVLRNSLVESLRSDMATAMHARGLSPMRIVLAHGLRLAAVPLMTVIGVQLGYLLGGAVVIEYIFNFPGLGLLTLNAVLRRDYPLLQLIVLVTALIFLVINLLIDLSYGFIDGRLATRRRVGGINESRQGGAS